MTNTHRKIMTFLSFNDFLRPYTSKSSILKILRYFPVRIIVI